MIKAPLDRVALVDLTAPVGHQAQLVLALQGRQVLRVLVDRVGQQELLGQE